MATWMVSTTTPGSRIEMVKAIDHATALVLAARIFGSAPLIAVPVRPPKYTIQADYSIASETTIVLFGGATWDDVQDGWYIKWGTFHYKLKSDPEDMPIRTIELDDVSLDSLDMKRPSGVMVFDGDSEVASA